jgi:hypothetical protein
VAVADKARVAKAINRDETFFMVLKIGRFVYKEKKF